MKTNSNPISVLGLKADHVGMDKSNNEVLNEAKAHDYVQNRPGRLFNAYKLAPRTHEATTDMNGSDPIDDV